MVSALGLELLHSIIFFNPPEKLYLHRLGEMYEHAETVANASAVEMLLA